MNLTRVLHKLGVRRGDLESTAAEGLMDADFQIPNMVCEGCAEKIDAALNALPGVREIRPHVREKRIQVRYEPAKVQPEQLKAAICEAGYTAIDVHR